MKIRKATADDINEIKQIYKTARAFMKKTGNPDQWKNNHPSDDIIESDIESSISHVITENDRACGVFVFFTHREPNYDYIEDGQWLSDEPYGTIHRIASDGTSKGIVAAAVDYALNFCKTIRIDTHHDNKVMQHTLEKNGFKRCGIIYLENGEKRIAFQKI